MSDYVAHRGTGNLHASATALSGTGLWPERSPYP